jgi:hypothetical protein
MVIGLDDAVQVMALAVAHMRDVHRRQRIVGQYRQYRAGRPLDECLLRQQGGQGAFQSAKIDDLIHRREP